MTDRKTLDDMTSDDLDQLYDQLDRVRALAEEYPVGIDTALIHEALDDTQPPATHVYLSTSCFHGDHDYCKNMTGLNGTKRPAECKFCGAMCRYSCHTEHPTPASAVEVRDPCPRCETCPLIPRHQMADHIREHHPEEKR